jgi:hypothetical protein
MTMWRGDSEPGDQVPAGPHGEGAFGATAYGGRIFDGAAYGEAVFDDGIGEDAAHEGDVAEDSGSALLDPAAFADALLESAAFADAGGRPARLKQAAAASRRLVTGPIGYPADEQAGVLRSWVAGWSHRIEMGAAADRGGVGSGAEDVPDGAQRRPGDSGPAGVRRLAEAVVDVLLERRPAEHVRRLVTREVFGLLSSVARRRATARFARRCVVRSIRLHSPASDAVESTVLVQDGPRVRAVALRFERAVTLREAAPVHAAPIQAAPIQDQDRLEWRCTALQFA